jgi:hypothetical protein
MWDQFSTDSTEQKAVGGTFCYPSPPFRNPDRVPLVVPRVLKINMIVGQNKSNCSFKRAGLPSLAA